MQAGAAADVGEVQLQGPERLGKGLAGLAEPVVGGRPRLECGGYLGGDAILELDLLQDRDALLGGARTHGGAVAETEVLQLPVEVDVGILATVEVAEEALLAAAEPGFRRTAVARCSPALVSCFCAA